MKCGLFQLPDDSGETNVRTSSARPTTGSRPERVPGFETPLARNLHGLLPRRSRRSCWTPSRPCRSLRDRRPLRRPSIQRAPIQALITEGLVRDVCVSSGASGPETDLFAVVRTEPDARSLEPTPSSFSIASYRKHGPRGRIAHGLDRRPGEGAVVTGPLRVTGWACGPRERISSSPFSSTAMSVRLRREGASRGRTLLRREDARRLLLRGLRGLLRLPARGTRGRTRPPPLSVRGRRERHYPPRRSSSGAPEPPRSIGAQPRVPRGSAPRSGACRGRTPRRPRPPPEAGFFRRRAG